ncbi:MAG TPA: CocE/NonD family hydrolase [Solirubrobacteraceae bacterium]|nr:CocE/NonD family hydrolase [Solirubrobacteraceae bacterium]
MLAAVGSASADIPVPSSLPPQTYPSSVSKQQFVMMDDGVQLGVTITFPSKDGSTPAPGKFPVVLAMTPYGRDGVCGCSNPADFATRGFVFAIADVRGTGGSQGNLNGNYFSPREAKDGYDLVEWLGTQPWSTGKVGMDGGSYIGITQLKTAELDPPHLAAIAPDESLADIYDDAYAPGGIVSASFDGQYIAVQGAPGLLTPNTDPSMLQGTVTAKADQATSAPVALDYLENPFDDAFYQLRNPITLADRITVPAFITDGWRDGFFVSGDARMFEALVRRGAPTYLNIGPCTHKGCGGAEAPTLNPPDVDNTEAQELQFDQKYLMGMNVPDLPRVRVYDQQADRYVESGSWPLSQATTRREYLGAASIASTGTITDQRPARSSASYPANPAAGYSMALDGQGTVAISPYVPTDQRLEDGQGLTWRTPAMTKPLTIAGPVALHLVAASSATNTDWFVKISDVAPDGTESIVAEGQLRASLRALAPGSKPTEPRHPLVNPSPVTPHQFYDYQIALQPTAYTFVPGDKLQIRITSGNVPNSVPGTVFLDANNPTTPVFTPLPPAINTVMLGGRDGTSLLLPVLG